MTIFLHGFWSQPADWNPVLNRLPLAAPVWIPDLYEAGPLAPDHTLDKWTSSFINLVSQRFAEPVQLVGYSMGGRLALSALVAAPQLFRRALIVSAAPLIAKDELSARHAWEKSWADKFLRNTWEELELDWQDQAVLNTSPALPRRHSVLMREKLALSLLHWSPRLHAFGPREIMGLPAHVEWAFGALDQKYVEFAKILANLPVKGQISVLPQAGHRLPIQAPDFISGWVTSA